ncbi:MAG: hypothetical protein OXG92_02790 [Chloroflexi bacterium]|nr:hypothetical protein [Chloroflexota bacterium]MXV92766.1 hypothetical protein [Chloroflexota bacterium]MYA93732.1 hypothetical protein [Chloroflexota bacterium]MYC54207.1 hypothetical protein [Chloroflexota bacterium]
MTKARCAIRPFDNLRRHELDPDTPLDFTIAADARGSRTDYCDDQAWRVKLGTRNEPVLALQTQFGGRADLVSLEPSIRSGDMIYHQQWAYARSPVVTHFAPNLIQLEASLSPDLQLVARFWAMESRAAGGELQLKNLGGKDITLQLELHGSVIIGGRKRKLNMLTLADGTLALHLGEIGNINPVLTLEGASSEIYGWRIRNAKLGMRLRLLAGHSARIPFVCAGLADLRDSFSLAMNWLSRPWDRHYAQIDRQAAAVPKISTGNADWDLVIDWSTATLLKAFLNATDALPEPSFVGGRAVNRGWSRNGRGDDHIRSWAGQDPTVAYLALPAIATIEPAFAKAIIRNYLATQDASGFVDRQPGLAGQRQDMLMMPLLARMSWLMVERTADIEFAQEVFPALQKFFQRWFAADMDADGDGLPEWQSERQMGYVAFPTFGSGRGWSQGADTRLFECPDLLAYLISEAAALVQLAQELDDDESQTKHSQTLAALEAGLEALWVGRRYGYRDRDTHVHNVGRELLRGGAGDERHIINERFAQPARVLARIVGGVSQAPRIRLKLDGLDIHGAPCTVEAAADEIRWQNRQGVFTSPQPLSALHSLEVEGLSRVYKVYASAIDSSRLDINALLPLWTGRLPRARAQSLVALALDESHFLRANGLSMVSASDPDFDPSNVRGGGGIWMFWQALLGEGMLAAGFRAESTALLQRVLTRLSAVLGREGRLAQFYHADEIQGFGEAQHVAGSLPLKWLNDALGIQIRTAASVWVGGEFSWGAPIRIEQHGVIVQRSAAGTEIHFPSGYKEALPADAPDQLVIDPTLTRGDIEERPALPAPPVPADPDRGTVVIEVEDDADSDTED